MSTGISDWVNLGEIGAIYPFVGAEWLLVLLAVVFWIWWHVQCIRQENRELEEAAAYYRRIGVEKAMDSKAKPRLPGGKPTT